jgi:hypothetical protein
VAADCRKARREVPQRLDPETAAADIEKLL